MRNSNFFEVGIAAQTDDGKFAYPASLVILPDGRLMTAFTWVGVFNNEARNKCCVIYSSDGGKTWTEPEVLFDQNCPFVSPLDELQNFADPNISVMRNRIYVSCVSLRYDPEKWDLSSSRIWYRISDDSGRTWSSIMEAPKHKKYISGMIHSGLTLQDGSVILGYSWDESAENGRTASGEGGQNYYAGVLRSVDSGTSWVPGGDVYVHVEQEKKGKMYAIFGADEPAIAELDDGTLYMLVRTGTDHLWETKSTDKGMTWSRPEQSPLVSHNCPASLLKLQSGEILVVYNDHPIERARLCARISKDSCHIWSAPKVFAPVGFTEEPEASYPVACQLEDGTIIAVWGQIKRSDPNGRYRIHYARFSREWVMDV